jgi:hypothetical protein
MSCLATRWCARLPGLAGLVVIGLYSKLLHLSTALTAVTLVGNAFTVLVGIVAVVSAATHTGDDTPSCSTSRGACTAAGLLFLVALLLLAVLLVVLARLAKATATSTSGAWRAVLASTLRCFSCHHRPLPWECGTGPAAVGFGGPVDVGSCCCAAFLLLARRSSGRVGAHGEAL